MEKSKLPGAVNVGKMKLPELQSFHPLPPFCHVEDKSESDMKVCIQCFLDPEARWFGVTTC